MDNSQVTAAVDALWLDKPTRKDYRLAVKCIRRILGDDVADILAYLGLT